MDEQNFVKRHSVAICIVLAFTIAWVGSFVLVGPRFVAGSAIEFSDAGLMPIVMLGAPFMAGLLMTYLADGKSRSGARDEIVVVAVGEINAKVLAHLRRELAKTFGRPSRVGKALPIPSKALDPSRTQYFAGTVLEELHPAEGERMLAVADLDMYVPGLNFVFGLADLPGRCAVVALPRLRERFYGRHNDEELFLARVTKEAVHELGHTFSLQHCANKRCVMAFSNCLEDTDHKEKAFCSACRTKVSGLPSPLRHSLAFSL